MPKEHSGSRYFLIDVIFFLAGWGAALSARIPSAVSHETRTRTGPRRSGSAIPGRKIGRHGVEVAILPPHS